MASRWAVMRRGSSRLWVVLPRLEGGGRGRRADGDAARLGVGGEGGGGQQHKGRERGKKVTVQHQEGGKSDKQRNLFPGLGLAGFQPPPGRWGCWGYWCLAPTPCNFAPC